MLANFCVGYWTNLEMADELAAGIKDLSLRDASDAKGASSSSPTKNASVVDAKAASPSKPAASTSPTAGISLETFANGIKVNICCLCVFR